MKFEAETFYVISSSDERMILCQAHTCATSGYGHCPLDTEFPIVSDSNCAIISVDDQVWQPLHGDLRPTNCQRMGGKMCGWKGKQKIWKPYTGPAAELLTWSIL